MFRQRKIWAKSLSWEELGISKEIKATQDIRNTVSRREGGQVR